MNPNSDNSGVLHHDPLNFVVNDVGSPVTYGLATKVHLNALVAERFDAARKEAERSPH